MVKQHSRRNKKGYEMTEHIEHDREYVVLPPTEDEMALREADRHMPPEATTHSHSDDIERHMDWDAYIKHTAKWHTKLPEMDDAKFAQWLPAKMKGINRVEVKPKSSSVAARGEAKWVQYALRGLLGSSADADMAGWRPQILRVDVRWWRNVGGVWLEMEDENEVKSLIMQSFVAVPAFTVESSDGKSFYEGGGGLVPPPVLLKWCYDLLYELAVPPAVAKHIVPAARRNKPFNLVSGEAERGVAFANAIVELDYHGFTFSEPRLDRFYPVRKNYDFMEKPKRLKAWQKLMDGASGGDAELQRQLELMFGAVVLEDTSHQRAYALIGKRRSGKSTLLKVLRAAVGDGAWVELSIKRIDEKFDAPDLVQRSLVLLDEIGTRPSGGSAQHAWDTGVNFMKRLVGQDPIPGRRMYQTKKQHFHAYANMIIFRQHTASAWCW